jgi:hypothetical protein
MRRSRSSAATAAIEVSGVTVKTGVVIMSLAFMLVLLSVYDHVASAFQCSKTKLIAI